MKFAKKLSAVLVSLVLLTLLASAVWADEAKLTIEAGSAEAAPGEEVTVAISVTENPGIVALTLAIGYDSDVFTLENAEDAKLIDGDTTINTDTAGTCYAVFDNSLADADITTTGTLLTLTFTAAEDADEGEYAITVSVPHGAGSTAVSLVETAVTNGKITLAAAQTPVKTPEVDNKTGTETAAEVTFSEDGTTMSVVNDTACVVLVKKADGTYEKLTAEANADGGYDFDVSGLEEGDSIVVAVKGDVNGDGKVDATDYAIMKRIVAGTYSASDIAEFTGNINNTNELDTTDYAMLKRMVAGTYSVAW